MKSIDDFIISWNLKFKWDRKWRKRYNIPFGSKQHLEISQIDVWFDIQEDKLLARLEKEYRESIKDQKEYKTTGKFLKDRTVSKDKEEELFKKLRLSFKTK